MRVTYTKHFVSGLLAGLESVGSITIPAEDSFIVRDLLDAERKQRTIIGTMSSDYKVSDVKVVA